MKVHLTARHGEARLLVDGVDISRHVLADSFEIELRDHVPFVRLTLRPFVRLTLRPTELTADLDEALVEMARAEIESSEEQR